MKGLFIALALCFSLTSFAGNSHIQCEARFPGYEQFRLNMNFQDIFNPELHILVIQGGVFGNWIINGMRVESDEAVTKVRFMLNVDTFAVVSMPNEIFDAPARKKLKAKMEVGPARYKTTCFAIR